MLENFIHGFLLLVSDPFTLLLFFAGLFGGLIFGAFPGVNSLTLCAIILPFTASLTPSDGIMLFSVIYCSGTYAGAVTAILFNIPGSPENAPTCFDGYPMTLQGKASLAIGAAVTCSALGGMFSAVVMMFATPMVADVAVRAFGQAEIFALIFFGLTVAGTVGAKSVWKGWLSVLFGLFLASVGTDAAEGVPRYTFGSYYLRAGIHFIPVILGFFAVAEVLIQGQRIAEKLRVPPKVSVEFPSFLTFWRLRIAIVRSMLIGLFAGVLPGIGGTLGSFLSYGEAVRWSRNRERFGKGEIEGVVAAETANNAASGGAMIPLLALGLPGGALTAMMLGVFQIHGMEPGPSIMMTSKDLVWVTFVAMFMANALIFVLGYVETKTTVHLLRIPFPLLAPAILVLSTIGAYSLRNLIIDAWVMYIAGIAAYFLRKWGYSAAGVVLGIILGYLGESAFVKTMKLYEYDLSVFMTRPISASLILLGLATMVYGMVRRNER